jgi:two-component sensor histidine kinase
VAKPGLGGMIRWRDKQDVIRRGCGYAALPLLPVTGGAAWANAAKTGPRLPDSETPPWPLRTHRGLSRRLARAGADRQPARFQTHLLGFALAVALPLVLLAVMLAYWSAMERRSAVLGGMAETARALQLAVDRDLRAAIAALEALSTSPALDQLVAEVPGEDAGFRAQAETLMRRQAVAANAIVLTTTQGRQIFNTQLESAPPPDAPDIRGLRPPEGARRPAPPETAFQTAVETRQPAITPLLWGEFDRRFLAIAVVPVIRQGEVVALLGANLLPGNLAQVLRAQAPMEGWTASLVDDNGVLVARTPMSDALVGRPVSEAVWRFLSSGTAETMMEVTSFTGGRGYVQIRRLAAAPWSVGYFAPQAAVDALIWQVLAVAAAAGLAAVALAVLGALLVGRHLGREIAALGADAAALAGEEAVVPRPPSAVREVAALRLELARAGETLRERAAAKRLAEERQALMSRELDHRAKNMLAVVLSVIRVTPRQDAAAFAASVEGRVTAMARALSLLSAENWWGADLRRLAQGELAGFAGRATLEGPPAQLAAGAVQPVAMVLYELATNASKYGALSKPEGRLLVSWTLPAGEGLLLVWQELDGPGVRAPERSGFGLRLLQRLAESQLGGGIDFHWSEDGLVVTLRIPARFAGPLERG